MSLWSRLFGGDDRPAAEAPAEPYKGFIIRPDPIAEGGLHRISAWIEKEVGGELLRHHLIRADTLTERDAAATAAIAKAKALIDEQGERLFDRA